MTYDYDNNLPIADIVVNPFVYSPTRPVTYRQVADTSVDFDRVSPKLGMTYQINPANSLFLAYREAFRAPSEGQLFRLGGNAAAVDLKPVKVKSLETGVRGKSGSTSYSVSLYAMKKIDDILRYEDPVTSERSNVNAGETLHQGIEVGISSVLSERTSIDIATSYAKHTYEDWVVNSTTDYSDNEMSSAPRLIMNVRLGHKVAILNNGKIELEWEKLGSYWMNDTNTEEYAGHDLFNVRANYPVNKNMQFYGRIMNVTDERYATAASFSSGSRQFAPGMPRTAYVGVNYSF